MLPGELTIIVKDLQQQLFKRNFIANFIQWHGNPQWNKAIKIKKTNPGCVTIAIPTFKDGVLTAFIAATITPNNKILFEIHRSSTVTNGLKEYSYIGINLPASKFYLSLFSSRKKVVAKSKSAENNVMEPCEYCWWEWDICPGGFTSGSDSTSENMAPGGGGPRYCWNYFCEIDDCNGGGGGGGGCTICPPECPEPFWYSFFPVEDPCGPPPPPPPLPTDPCIIANNAAKKMDILYIKGKVDSMLNTMPGWENYTVEKGYAILKDCRKINGDTVVTGYVCSSIQTGTDSSLTITANTTQYSPNHFELWTGWLHTHPPKVYPCPSPADMYNLIAEAGTPKFDGVIIAAANGNKYAITVTDPYAANAFFATKSQFLNGIKWNETSPIGMAFKEAQVYYKGIYKAYDTITRRNLVYEMAMAAVLKQFNTGITLLKREPEPTSNFKPLVVITTVPNPNKPKKKVYTQYCTIIE